MSDRANVLVEGSHAFYRASSSGLCVKALAALRMGMDPVAPSPEMKLRFQDGHLHEPAIIEAVEKELNQAVVRRQEEWSIPISSRITVVGHVDGIAADDLRPVEVKSASKSEFADWEKSPEAWFGNRRKNADQWTMTLTAFGASTGYYAVKNKDSSKVLVREIGAPGTLQEVKVRLLKADLDGRRGKLPECDVKGGDRWFCPVYFLHDDEKDQTPEEVDEVLDGLAVAYDEAREAEKRAEAVKKELGERLAVAMGEREKVRTGVCQVTMVPWRRTSWDKDKLAEVVGDLTPFEVVKTGMSVRVMMVREDDA